MRVRAAWPAGGLRCGPDAASRGQAPRRALRVPCPVCDSKDDLVNLTYVFGDQLGQFSGRIKQTAELEEMAHQFGEFKVVVVEVCLSCGWNHMILSYLLGDGVKRKPPRRQQTVEDIYG